MLFFLPGVNNNIFTRVFCPWTCCWSKCQISWAGIWSGRIPLQICLCYWVPTFETFQNYKLIKIIRMIFNLHRLFLVSYICIWSFDATCLFWNISITYGCEATEKMRFPLDVFCLYHGNVGVVPELCILVIVQLYIRRILFMIIFRKQWNLIIVWFEFNVKHWYSFFIFSEHFMERCWLSVRLYFWQASCVANLANGEHNG